MIEVVTDFDEHYFWAGAKLNWTDEGFRLEVAWTADAVDDRRRDQMITNKILDKSDLFLPAKGNRLGTLSVGVGYEGLILLGQDLLQCAPARMRVTVEQATSIALDHYGQLMEREDAAIQAYLLELAPERDELL